MDFQPNLSEIYHRHQGPGWGVPNQAPGSDKGSVHAYIEPYAELLAPYRATTGKVLEIGILTGDSLRMWEEYFFQAEVHGIDLPEDEFNRPLVDLSPMVAEGTHHIHLVNATDSLNVRRQFKGMAFDVVIEDASHALSHQLMIYENFREFIIPGGIYIIEDVANIDVTRSVFEKLLDPTKNVRVLDLRRIKDRFDDVLVVVTDK